MTQTKSMVARIVHFFLLLSFTFLVFVTVIGGGIYFYFSISLPEIIKIEDYKPSLVTQIFAPQDHLPGDVQGPTRWEIIGEFYKERRYLVEQEQVPEHVTKAFIAAEDDQFYEHRGINVASIIRAMIANFRAGHIVQGGSTITQQVAKSLLLSPERSFTRKFKEAILASRIERHLSKEQILYLYLNQIYLGYGAYGVQAASRLYFKKDVKDINLAEAALLAGLPQAPGRFSPHVNPRRAKLRQKYVLMRMRENRFINEEQFQAALNSPIKIYFQKELNKEISPHLVEQVRRELLESYGEKMIYEEGLRVYINAPVSLSLSARNSLQDGLREVEKRRGYSGPISRVFDKVRIDEILAASQKRLIADSLGFQLFMPAGKLEGGEDLLNHIGLKNTSDLLAVGKIYRAVVMEVNDEVFEARVKIGTIDAILPMSQMSWAKKVLSVDGAKRTLGQEPKKPSQVVSPGHVVLVKVVRKSTENEVFVSLEQEPELEAALFSIEVNTGNVVAMIGGYDFNRSEFNRTYQASRQPGSAFKPVIYSAALEKGYTPVSIIYDSPIVYEDSESGKWKPSNFSEKFYGDTTFRQALIKSRNVPTIKVVQDVGVSYVIEYARRLGMKGQFNQDLSISLGSNTTTLKELTCVYSVFPRLGRRINPVLISRVIDRNGKVLEEHFPTPLPDSAVFSKKQQIFEEEINKSEIVLSEEELKRKKLISDLSRYPIADDPDQIMDPRVSYLMTHLLREVVNFGTGRKARGLGRPAAGKTGTTNEYMDAWFLGFTSNIITGVWVGYDDQRSIGHHETGAVAALPIWLAYMKSAIKFYPEQEFRVPKGIVFASIDPKSGQLAPPNSSYALKEAFIEGTEPEEKAQERENTPKSDEVFFKEEFE